MRILKFHKINFKISFKNMDVTKRVYSGTKVRLSERSTFRKASSENFCRCLQSEVLDIDLLQQELQ